MKWRRVKKREEPSTAEQDRVVRANRRSWALCRLAGMRRNVLAVGESIAGEIADEDLRVLVREEVADLSRRLGELDELLRAEWDVASRDTEED